MRPSRRPRPRPDARRTSRYRSAGWVKRSKWCFSSLSATSDPAAAPCRSAWDRTEQIRPARAIYLRPCRGGGDAEPLSVGPEELSPSLPIAYTDSGAQARRADRPPPGVRPIAGPRRPAATAVPEAALPTPRRSMTGRDLEHAHHPPPARAPMPRPLADLARASGATSPGSLAWTSHPTEMSVSRRRGRVPRDSAAGGDGASPLPGRRAAERERAGNNQVVGSGLGG